jgi:hypothetical protein
MNHSTAASGSITDFLRAAPSGASAHDDDFLAWLDGQLRGASQAIIEATLPPDVHQRYDLVKRDAARKIGEHAETIRRTLVDAKIDDVLAGAVAEKVRSGIAELTADGDYSRAVKGTGR